MRLNRRLYQTSCLLAALTLLLGCASRPAPLARNVVRDIRAIAVMDIREPDKHVAYNYIHPATVVGIVGTLAAEVDLDFQSQSLSSLLSEQKLQVGERLSERLRNNFTQMGYRVQRLADLRSTEEGAEARFDPASTTVATDAILDVRVLKSGYVSSIGLNGYEPSLVIEAVLYAKADGAEIYRTRMAYGMKPWLGGAIIVPASPSYTFTTFSRLRDHIDRAAEGLYVGSERLAGRLAQEFPRVSDAMIVPSNKVVTVAADATSKTNR